MQERIENDLFDIAMTEQTKVCLFCFTHAGGWPSVFDNWRDWMPKEIEVVPVKLPGRGERLEEQSYTDLEQLIEEVTQAIMNTVKLPVAFYGSCFGAVCAYETIRVLKIKQFMGTVQHLFVSSQEGPAAARSGKLMHNLEQIEFVDALIQEGALDEELREDDDILDILLPSIRADYTIYENYVYEKRNRLDVPITAVLGKSDDTVEVIKTRRWQDETKGKFNLYEIDGKHIFNELEQRQLIEIIEKELYIEN